VAPKFEAEIQQLEALTYVKLSGTIDEDNELAPLSGRVRGEMAIIDLAGVSDINNCGVRDWVRCLENLQEREIVVVLVECSPAIVSKLNTVSNFIENGYVKSFYVPYFCQACEMEKALLVDMDEFRGGEAVATPTCRCDSCDGIMAFDAMEGTYFAFVKDARLQVPPDAMHELLDQISPAAGERKIISRGTAGGSSFAGIPSTASSMSGDFGTGVSGVAAPSSAATLRRLRDKTGLRTMRKPSSEAPAKDSGGSNRWLLIVLVVTALAVIAGVVVVLTTR
jgi:anti-anti-sigma regulatory factor